MTDPPRLADAVSDWADAAGTLLEQSGRADRAQEMRSLGRRVADGVLRVLVVGDFKQGKSTLVNAILGTSVCSTDEVVSSTVPTLCRHSEEAAAYVTEHRDGKFRRQPVSNLESTSIQEGRWPKALMLELQLPADALARGLEVIDFPPGTGHHAASAATLDAARDADIVLLLSDATQPLTEPEIDLLRDLSAVASTKLVVTKCDLVAPWRDIVSLNRAALDERSIDCDVVTVSAALSGEDDGEDADASGVSELLAGLLTHRDDGRLGTAAHAAAANVVQTLSEARDRQVVELNDLGDRDRLRERVRQAAVDLDRCESLRNPSATWSRVLEAGCEEISHDVAESTATRLDAVLADAKETVAQINPLKDWETFEPSLRDACSVVAHSSLSDVDRRLEELASAVGQAFSQAPDGTLISALPAGSTLDLHAEVDLDLSTERKATRFVREGFATLGSTSAGLFAFATLGGVFALAIMAPLTVILGAGLGGSSVAQERRAIREQRQTRAVEAIGQYTAFVRDEVGDAVDLALSTFRTGTADVLMSRAESLVSVAHITLEEARGALDDADAARGRMAQIEATVAEIDDLVARIGRSLPDVIDREEP